MTKKLTFNGKSFAHLSSTPATGCHGFFKVLPAGNVALYKPDGKLEAAIINNKRQGRFVVTAGTDSSGRDFFMHSTSSLTEKWLGIEDMSLSDLDATIGNMRLDSGTPMPQPKIGETGFDTLAQEAQWATRPISMKLIEYCGDGDPAFGGSADDRVLLDTGRVSERMPSAGEKAAEFQTVAQAHEFALVIPNRRPGSILGLAPKWR